jgi:hypothetical protein
MYRQLVDVKWHIRQAEDLKWERINVDVSHHIMVDTGYARERLRRAVRCLQQSQIEPAIGGAPHSLDRKSPFLRWIAAVVGPVGAVGNSERFLRRVFQALWKRWENLFGSSIFPPFPWRVSFHRPSFFFLFCFVFLSLRFPQENFALGCPRNDDRPVG